jgi:N-alpha-acetyltransferase 35, NatC auxiliary subunit
MLYCEKKIYGRHGFMDWMTEEMVLNGVPSVLLSTQEGVQYSSRAIETLYESLKLYLHNRSRQRARIEYLLEEWAVLQLEAVAVDERFMSEMQIPKAAFPRYFTAWTLEQVTVLMIQYVLLGIELDLYAPNELSTIYWYLDYLCGSRLQNLSVTWGFLERMKELLKDRGGDKGAGGDAKDALAKARFERETSYTEMLRSMMRGYFQVFAAMERESRAGVAAAAPVYGSRAVRFQHRFATFQSLHFPAALTYDDYVANSDFARYPVDLIYKSAEECFRVARGHGDELLALETTQASGIHADEARDVVHVAVANLVELARHEQDQQQRTQAGKGSRQRTKATNYQPTPTPTSSSGNGVDLDFAKHPHFAVLSIGRNDDGKK